MLVALLVSGLVSMTGCGDDSRPDAAVDSGRRDSGRFDSSIFDSGSSSDGATDSGAVDSSTSDSAPGDGGTAAVVVDGVISPSEWDGAIEASNGVASSWGTNTLTQIRALVADGRLYLSVDAALEAGAENTVVLYIDNERTSGSGVTDPAALTDTDGALDNALSAAIITPADFRADFAWGTRDLGRVADAFDDRRGFRDIATNPGDFAWVDSTEAPTVCSATVCEASIRHRRVEPVLARRRPGEPRSRGRDPSRPAVVKSDA
ncbi:MAG: hypothetical protein JRH11_22225 [Deltaproteobacteria bacterium]|nr:hypothetical protein [Deltaproteobacteria bacterium]